MINTSFQKNIISIYLFYRILVGSLFCIKCFAQKNNSFLSFYDFDIFYYSSFIYLFLNLSILIFKFETNKLTVAILDLTILSIIFLSSNGVNSSVSLLIILSTILNCFVLERNTSYLVALLSTIVILYKNFSQTKDIQNFINIDSIIQSLLCLFLSLVANYIRFNIDNFDKENKKQKKKIIVLEDLSSQILNLTQLNYIVFDQNLENVYSNFISNEKYLKDTFTSIENLFNKWIKTKNKESYNLSYKSKNYQASFSKLKQKELYILMLEDINIISKKNQQMKLASLGKLTSNIAHEIRNPLGAISHSLQLLEEEEKINGYNKKLIQIGLKQTDKINAIIKNILFFSKKAQNNLNEINLNKWLKEAISHIYLKEGQKVSTNIINEEINIMLDPAQMEQAISNLILNGFKHGQIDEVIIDLYKNENNKIILDVKDEGIGIETDKSQFIFDPFYTNSHDGIGLGLYLAYESVQLNMGTLTYLPNKTKGSIFRITFH